MTRSEVSAPVNGIMQCQSYWERVVSLEDIRRKALFTWERSGLYFRNLFLMDNLLSTPRCYQHQCARTVSSTLVVSCSRISSKLV